MKQLVKYVDVFIFGIMLVMGHGQCGNIKKTPEDVSVESGHWETTAIWITVIIVVGVGLTVCGSLCIWKLNCAY